MSRISRFVVLVTLFALGGCNLVIAEKPWFVEKDGEGAPPLRDGLWANISKGRCAFDPATPVSAWPECAEAMTVRKGRYYVNETQGPDMPIGKDGFAHVLVPGNPMIDQIEVSQEAGEGGKQGEKFHVYFGILVQSLDAQGRVVAMTRWPVVCGPKPRSASSDSYVTDRPFPGLVRFEESCIASSADALRKAAAASQKIARKNGAPITVSRWIRDGGP